MPLDKRQLNAAAKKKGQNIQLFAEHDDGLLEQVAGEDQGLRTVTDVQEWMEENKFVGTLCILRGTQTVTREEQKSFQFKVGNAKVEAKKE